MLNYIWTIMIFVSFMFSIFTGNIEQLSASVLNGADSAVQLLISIIGILCFWSGMMEIADRSGVTNKLSYVFSPVLSRLLRNTKAESPAMRYISLNISANLLGLGNAATPLGLKAMKELQKVNNNKLIASDDMVTFVVLNTASLQLIPTTLCAYRSSYGSTAPFEIIPLVWLTSIIALCVAVITAKVLMLPKERI